MELEEMKLLLISGLPDQYEVTQGNMEYEMESPSNTLTWDTIKSQISLRYQIIAKTLNSTGLETYKRFTPKNKIPYNREKPNGNGPKHLTTVALVSMSPRYDGI